ncbi:MAG: hypothetical protein JXA92_11495 [candidate division Zixibacteria bacterium]|nr:hypothetical protein [candidate division Zixibacteria bacterium]
MCRKIVSIIFMVLVLLAVSHDDSLAFRKRGKRPVKKPAKIFQTKFAFDFKLTTGFVVGGASGAIDRIEGDEWKYKMLYGVGLALEYYYRPQHAFCFNIEALWKNLPGQDYGSIRIFTYSGAWMYRFTPQKYYSFYLRPELGFITGRAPDFHNIELGTHFFFRLGFGIFRYTAGWTNTRLELYYKMAFSSGYEVNRFDIEKVDFNAQCLGLEVGIGLPL